jgi:hypothetical protein
VPGYEQKLDDKKENCLAQEKWRDDNFHFDVWIYFPAGDDCVLLLFLAFGNLIGEGWPTTKAVLYAGSTKRNSRKRNLTMPLENHLKTIVTSKQTKPIAA